MKHLPLLLSLIVLTACVDYDDATTAVTATIRVGMPAEFTTASYEGHTVVLSLNDTQLTATTDAEGVARFTGLVPDVYTISCSWPLTADEYHRLTSDEQTVSGATVTGSLGACLIKDDATIDLPTRLSIDRDIVIGKIFYAGSRDLNNRTYQAGKFVELYNQSDDSADVSGLYIGLVEAESTQAYTLQNLHDDFADSVVLLKQVFRIPAGQPRLVPPGGTVLLVNSAVDHTPNDTLENNLTDADYEAKDLTGRTQNNPATPALELVYTMYPSISNMNLVQSGPCSVVIFRTDADVTQWPLTYAYGKTSGSQWMLVPRRCIIDAVECLRLTNRTPAVDVNTKRLADDLDAGYTNISAISGWNGEIVCRRVARVATDGHAILMDTNNSSRDFHVSSTIKPRHYDN